MKRTKRRTTAPYVFQRAGYWIFRYRETVNDGGTLRTVQRARKLCTVDSTNEAQARKLAEAAAAKLEQSRPANPEMVMALGDFVTRVYMPFVEKKLRHWTGNTYRTTWNKHFASRPHIMGMLLCDVKTANIYTWLEAIVATDKTDGGETLGSATVKHLKSLLSGIFTVAVNLGYVETNPVHGAMLPAGTEPKATQAYSLEEVAAMFNAQSDATARVMIALAAFTGLSRSEIRGLTWEAWRGDELHVLRGIVAGHVQEPKTPARKAPVPLIPSLVQMLAQHRDRVGNPVSGPMFATTNGSPLDPNNLLRDQMQPAFARAGITSWSGWHGFRRGLATNLYALKVPDLTIQRILRHANVGTTQRCYIKPLAADSVNALGLLDASLFSVRALESPVMAIGQLQ